MEVGDYVIVPAAIRGTGENIRPLYWMQIPNHPLDNDENII